MILWHGTTLEHTENILMNGPDPSFIEPGASGETDREFWCGIERGATNVFGDPITYAKLKSNLFPGERGPAILVIDVPQELVNLADLENYPLRGGAIPFQLGFGLEELSAAWSRLNKEIREVK
jgi:hypothetical protein